jgi:hypothetical protein
MFNSPFETMVDVGKFHIIRTIWGMFSRMELLGFHKLGYSNSWMVCNGKSQNKMDDEKGYLHIEISCESCPGKSNSKSALQIKVWPTSNTAQKR